MSHIVVPSLSARGWASDVTDKADLLLAYYFSTDYLQSVAWIGKVTSFQETLSKYHHNPSVLKTRVENEVGDQFSRYFDSVTASASVDTPDTNKPNEIQLTLRVNVQQGDQTYSLGRVVETIDATIKTLFDLNNG